MVVKAARPTSIASPALALFSKNETSVGLFNLALRVSGQLKIGF